MKEDTKGLLAYGAVVAVSLAAVFSIAASNIMSHGKTDITVNPQAHEITEKNELIVAFPYYSDMHTVTTVFNLDSNTKTSTDTRLTTAGLMVTQDSKTQTLPINPNDLADLAYKSSDAAALIKAAALRVN